MFPHRQDLHIRSYFIGDEIAFPGRATCCIRFPRKSDFTPFYLLFSTRRIAYFYCRFRERVLRSSQFDGILLFLFLFPLLLSEELFSFSFSKNICVSLVIRRDAFFFLCFLFLFFSFFYVKNDFFSFSKSIFVFLLYFLMGFSSPPSLPLFFRTRRIIFFSFIFVFEKYLCIACSPIGFICVIKNRHICIWRFIYGAGNLTS